MKGDKISVNKGECTGMRGNVIEIEGGMVTFKPIDLPQLGFLQVDIGHVSKYFEPGDMVRITEGKYRGETGQVMDVDGNKVSMVLHYWSLIRVNLKSASLLTTSSLSQTLIILEVRQISADPAAQDMVTRPVTSSISMATRMPGLFFRYTKTTSR